MKRINVVGIGPGGPGHMTRAALEAIAGSAVIIGGARNLESLDTAGKEVLNIGSDLENTVSYIKEKMKTGTVSVIVSGDPGFHSMLGYLKKNFSGDELNVIPGISPVQYLFSKICMTWEDAFLVSMHGREADAAEIVRKHRKAAFLTDKKNTYQKIAASLAGSGLGKCRMYVGADLSYPGERIITGSAHELAGNSEILDLCVVIILYE